MHAGDLLEDILQKNGEAAGGAWEIMIPQKCAIL